MDIRGFTNGYEVEIRIRVTPSREVSLTFNADGSPDGVVIFGRYFPRDRECTKNITDSLFPHGRGKGEIKFKDFEDVVKIIDSITIFEILDSITSTRPKG